MAFYKWHLEVVQEVRNMQILYKIAMRWSNMTICSAFMTWHENTSGAIGRARDSFQRFAVELMHAEKEKEPFAMFSDTISLQIAKMKERKSWLVSCCALRKYLARVLLCAPKIFSQGFAAHEYVTKCAFYRTFCFFMRL